MKISLRKAAQLQNDINYAVSSIPVDSLFLVELNEFQDPLAQINAARDQLIQGLNRRRALITANYAIRKLVSTANGTYGVNDLLTQAAELDKQIALLDNVAASAVRTDHNIILGQLGRLKATPDNQRSIYRDTVRSGSLFQSDVDEIKAESRKLKKLKIKINDQILHANVSGEITLDQTTVDVLTQENVL